MKSLLIQSLLLLGLLAAFSACQKEEDPKEMETMTRTYDFNTGQVSRSYAYTGAHTSTFKAELMLEEMENDMTKITVKLINPVAGQTYNVHAHDKADPATTPNGTPYIETPNALIFAQTITAAEGEKSFTSDMSFEKLTTEYEGFFVIHDPLQPVTTTDPTTYIILGDFAKESDTRVLMKKTFDYDFNTGQIAAAYAYAGSHPTNFKASITLEEMTNDETKITVELMDAVAGETYAVHAHDKADATTTPNATPYNETPNSSVYAQMITAAQGSMSFTSNMTFVKLTTEYEGFFVIHDPLQPINTADPTTYIVLGNFAR